ncbi:MAG TPA: hypothetical protein VGQ52_18675 [Gemmatimonadaceae bacterium]|nr:hypothetical protein [Gemmatimonadaceae bacterium]
MKYARLLLAVAIQFAASTALSAQERYSPLMAIIDRTGDFLIGLFERPLRPDFATVVPGSGIGAGLTLSARCGTGWCVDANGVVTVRRYWDAQGTLSYRTPTARVAAYVARRHMPKLDFFGLGSASAEADRTVFRLEDRLVGLQAEQRLSSWLALSARAEQLWPTVGSGRSSDLPSLDALFDEADAPGLTQQPNFARYEASLLVDIPAGRSQALNQGGEIRAAYQFYADRDLDRYSFRRFDLEVRQRFGLLGPLRRLTLHGRLSSTAASSGNRVPFYLMPTLGGLDLPLGPGDQTIGSDGTLATLRGFTNYRFRDRHLLLLQAEYRIPVWGPIDLSIFGDAGKVASSRDDLDLDGLRRDMGAGLSIMRGPDTAVRFDVGFGGGEGARLFLTVGRIIAP